MLRIATHTHMKMKTPVANQYHCEEGFLLYRFKYESEKKCSGTPNDVGHFPENGIVMLG